MVKPVDRGTTRTATIGAYQRRILCTLSLLAILLAGFAGIALAGSAPTDTLVLVRLSVLPASSSTTSLPAMTPMRVTNSDSEGCLEAQPHNSARVNSIIVDRIEPVSS